MFVANRDSSTHCPLCRGPIGAREGQRCGACEARQHTSCVRELGGCHPEAPRQPEFVAGRLDLSEQAPRLPLGSSARLRARQARAREQRLTATIQGLLLGVTFCVWLGLVPQAFAAHGLAGALGLILCSTLACFGVAGLAQGALLGSIQPPLEVHRVDLAEDGWAFLGCCLRWLGVAAVGAVLSGCLL